MSQDEEKTHRHFILHKPNGYLSQFIFKGRRASRRKLLGELHDFPAGTMAVGRLDQNSEGLLFLTTDGKVSNRITSSKYEKEYYVLVDGIITQEAIDKMKAGVEIGINGKKYMTKPCEAFLIEGQPDIPIDDRKVRDERHGPLSWARVILREGKFRQVRKMTAAVGHPTFRLVRVRIGNIWLTEEAGKVIEVNSLENDLTDDA